MHDILPHPSESYNDPSLATYNKEEDQSEQEDLSVEEQAKLTEEECEEYHKQKAKQAKVKTGEEQKDYESSFKEEVDIFEGELKDARKLLKKKIAQLTDPEKIKKGQELLATVEELLKELPHVKQDAVDGVKIFMDHNVTVTDHYIIEEGLNGDGSTITLTVMANTLFEDEDQQVIFGSQGEIITDVNGDGKITLADYDTKLSQESLKNTKIICRQGKYRLKNYDSATDTATFVVMTENGWNFVIIENVSRADLVFDQMEDGDLESISHYPEHLLRNMYAGDDQKSLFQRLVLDKLTPEEKIKWIKGYKELTDQVTFDWLYDNFKDSGMIKLAPEEYKEKLDDIFKDLFAFYDNPQGQTVQGVWGHIQQKLSGLSPTDQSNLMHFVVVGIFTYAQDKAAQLLGPVISSIEGILSKTLTHADKALILLLEYQLDGGSYGGAISVWSKVFSFNGEEAGEWEDHDHNIKALNYLANILPTLGLPIPLEIQTYLDYEESAKNYVDPLEDAEGDIDAE